MKKIYYNKLIRDKIPENIRAKGANLETRKLNRREFEKALIAKVEEEASGLNSVQSREEFVDELADVVEVIEEIKKLKKITAAAITKARRENREKKGGFKKRLFLIWSENNNYKTNEKRYGKK